MSLIPSGNGSVLSLLRALEDAGALTVTHLDLSTRPDLPLETCISLATFFGTVNSASRWWISDLHEYVEMRHGEYVAQVMDATGLAEQTIENIVSVGKRVPPTRRRPELKFSLHAEVASLQPNDQRHWLKVASEERLTVMQLRQKVKPKELPPIVKTIACPHCGHEIAV